MAEKRILCVWLPAWPIQRLLSRRPELRGRVVILHRVGPRRGRRVVACSQAAYRLGVRLEMPLAEASALLPAAACTPSLGNDTTSADASAPYLACHQLAQDREVLQQVAAACAQFSPFVGFEPLQWQPITPSTEPPSCFYLDVTNLGQHFGGDEELAVRVARFLEMEGYRVRIGVADTMGAAWAAAHFGMPWAQRLTAPDDGVQPVSSRSCSSYWVIAPAATRDALLPLPVAALRLQQATVAGLRQLGVLQIQQLMALPRAGLVTRFGTHVLLRWDQALGIQEEILQTYRAAPVFQVAHDLLPPTRNEEQINALLQQMLEELCRQLVTHQQGVQELECRFTCEPSCVPVTEAFAIAPSTAPLRIGSVRPTASAPHLFELLQLHRLRQLLSAPVAAVRLTATLTGRLATHQQIMFAGSTPAASASLVRLVDRLESRLGKGQIVQACLVAERQPERAYAYGPWAARTRRTRRAPARGRQSKRWPMPLPRPLLVRAPPVPLRQPAGTAPTPNMPPPRFWFAAQWQRVVRHWGPERLETGWWRGRSMRRDYYRVETASGQQLWLFHQLQDDQWFVHGTFE